MKAIEVISVILVNANALVGNRLLQLPELDSFGAEPLPKRVCVISLALPIETDPRTSRQVVYLARKYKVTLIGFGDPPAEWNDTAWKPVQRDESRIRFLFNLILLVIGRIFPLFYDLWFSMRPRYQQALRYALESRADAFHASDWATLVVCVKAAKQLNAPVVFDADEYWPLENETNRWWRVFFAPLIDYTLRKYSSKIDAATTVSKPIAERYQREYGLHATIVLNAPDYQEVLYHSPTTNHTRFVHHGAARRNRYLEMMIDALAVTDERFRLVFMLVGGDSGEDTGYLEQLRKYASSVASERVEFRNPVHPFQIVSTISDCDIGLCFIPPTTYTYKMTLPNKLFEFIMAGLAVVSGPSPAMAEVVEQYGVGWVTKDFSAEALAQTIQSLTVEQIEQARANAREAAKVLNAEVEYGKLLELYEELLA